LALAVEVAVGYTAHRERHARHANAHTRTNMSSPFSVPPSHDRNARAEVAAALARSRTRGCGARGDGGGGGGSGGGD